MTGKDLTVVLSRDGVALANTRIKSHDIQTGSEVIEKASATQQKWKEYEAGRNEWQLTVNYLVVRNSQVADLLLAGETFDVTVKSGNTNLLTGKAIMTQAKNVAAMGNLATGGFQLKGSGALAAVS